MHAGKQEAYQDSVDLVHRQLELLKYIGGFKYEDGQSTPTGEGVEVSIVTLPDLLLDFREDNVRTAQREGRICAVGGRAARTACVLLHLTTDCDGLYRVYLLTRTGNLGKLLLQNEFVKPEVKLHWDDDERKAGSSHTFQSLWSDTLLLREGEPRCALVTSKSGLQFNASKPHKDEELKKEDLNSYAIKGIISRARVLYLASIKTPNFHELLRELLEVPRSSESRALGHASGPAIFLDVTRAEPEDLETFHTVIRGIESDQREFLGGIFVPEPQDEHDCYHEASDLLRIAGAGSLGDLCGKYQVPLIHYGRKQCGIFRADLDKSVEVTVRSGASFGDEGIAERFKAGVLLAFSLYRTLDLHVRGSTLFSPLRDEWHHGKDGEWGVMLRYGLALATAPATEDGYVCLDDLLGRVRIESGEAEPDQLKVLWLRAPRDSDSRSNEMVIDSSIEKQVASLACARRQARGANACRDLPLCDEAKCAGGCLRCTREEAPHAAVMMDLDSTLLDTEEQTERALVQALWELEKLADGGVLAATGSADPIEKQRYLFWKKHVYERDKLYDSLRLGDFRQQANHAGWYAAYLVAAQRPDIVEELWTWYEQLGSERPEGWDKSPRVRAFRDAYEQAGREHRDQIVRAQAAFAAVEMTPLKEARDLLRSLQQTGAFHLYVVSEGDPEVQWHKIRSTGLDEFFDRSRVLTTKAAAEPIKEKADLADERARLAQKKTQVAAEAARLRGKLDQIPECLDEVLVQPEIEKVNPGDIAAIRGTFERVQTAKILEVRAKNAELGHLERQDKVIAFAGELLSSLNIKHNIYAAAIRAIFRQPKAPLAKLQSLEELARPCNPPLPPMKLAMVGDRLDKDIGPPTNLLTFPSILTIRLFSGKYARATGGHGHAPHYTAHTLAQVKALLLSPTVWSEVSCVREPPLFNLRVALGKDNYDFHVPAGHDHEDHAPGTGTVGLGLLREGIGMSEYPHTRSICRWVRDECLGRCSDQDRKTIKDELIDDDV